MIFFTIGLSEQSPVPKRSAAFVVADTDFVLFPFDTTQNVNRPRIRLKETFNPTAFKTADDPQQVKSHFFQLSKHYQPFPR